MAHFILGESYSALGRYAEAIESYEAMEFSVQSGNGLAQIAGEYHLPPEQLAFRLGRSYAALQLWDEAGSEFERGLQFNARELGCLVGAANVCFRKLEFEEANRSICCKLLRLHPNVRIFKGFWHMFSFRRLQQHRKSQNPNQTSFKRL